MKVLRMMRSKQASMKWMMRVLIIFLHIIVIKNNVHISKIVNLLVKLVKIAQLLLCAHCFFGAMVFTRVRVPRVFVPRITC